MQATKIPATIEGVCPNCGESVEYRFDKAEILAFIDFLKLQLED